MRFLLPVALAVALMTVSAEAQQGSVPMLGYGLSSCGTWTAERRDKMASWPEQWILGFLSGVGWEGGAYPSGPIPLIGVDAQAVWAWIDNYCGPHPLDTIDTAGAQFVLAHPWGTSAVRPQGQK
jgi:hypothetical protein